jgi:hypothetical protein
MAKVKTIIETAQAESVEATATVAISELINKAYSKAIEVGGRTDSNVRYEFKDGDGKYTTFDQNRRKSGDMITALIVRIMKDHRLHRDEAIDTLRWEAAQAGFGIVTGRNGVGLYKGERTDMNAARLEALADSL